nr:vitamin B12 dependent-methionine synthase activation domain-containing protein [Maliibacterium massiliense]
MHEQLYREALRYLGMAGAAPDAVAPLRIEEAFAHLARVVRPKCVQVRLRVAPAGDAVALPDACAAFHSADLARHLAGCDKAVLFAATLGMGVEQALAQLRGRDIARALVMDACATARIEQYCDQIAYSIARAAAEKGRYATPRFSVGYGDWPLAEQADVLRLTDATRRAGIYLTAGGLMLPQKSATAIIGLAQERQARSFAGCGGVCGACNMRAHCAFRAGAKGGETKA